MQIKSFKINKSKEFLDQASLPLSRLFTVQNSITLLDSSVATFFRVLQNYKKTI